MRRHNHRSFRTQWEQIGSLYGAAQEQDMEEDIRADMHLAGFRLSVPTYRAFDSEPGEHPLAAAERVYGEGEER